jgi:hypothetical protein
MARRRPACSGGSTPPDGRVRKNGFSPARLAGAADVWPERPPCSGSGRGLPDCACPVRHAYFRARALGCRLRGAAWGCALGCALGWGLRGSGLGCALRARPYGYGWHRLTGPVYRCGEYVPPARPGAVSGRRFRAGSTGTGLRHGFPEAGAADRHKARARFASTRGLRPGAGVGVYVLPCGRTGAGQCAEALSSGFR